LESEIEILDDGHFGKSGRKFIVYFLFDDEDQKVHVEEIKEIDLPRITKHLCHLLSIDPITKQMGPKYEYFCTGGSEREQRGM